MTCPACGEPGGPAARFCGRCGAPLRASSRVRAYLGASWVLVPAVAFAILVSWGMLEADTDMAGLLLYPIAVIESVCLVLLLVGCVGQRARRRWAYRLTFTTSLVAGVTILALAPVAIFVAPVVAVHFVLGLHRDVGAWFRVKG